MAFKNILKKGSPKLDEFDLFYLFFWVGLSTGKKTSTKGLDMKDTGSGKTYTAAYKGLKDMLGTVLVMSTSKSNGFNSRESLTTAIEKYMDSSSATALSQEGEELMMNYVQSGYLHMKRIMAEPTEPDVFIFRAYKEIEEGFSDNKDWNFS